MHLKLVIAYRRMRLAATRQSNLVDGVHLIAVVSSSQTDSPPCDFDPQLGALNQTRGGGHQEGRATTIRVPSAEPRTRILGTRAVT